MGKYTWANGNSYDGEWKNDKKDGDATYYDATTGETRRGIWADDNRIGWF